MRELLLKYERGTTGNIIDVCTQDNIFLGTLIGDPLFRTISFNQETTTLIIHEIDELRFVAETLAKAMGWSVL